METNNVSTEGKPGLVTPNQFDQIASIPGFTPNPGNRTESFRKQGKPGRRNGWVIKHKFSDAVPSMCMK